MTTTTRALSLDADLADRIPVEGYVAVVQSTYDKVINLLPPDGRLCCLSTAALDDAPRTIRITEKAWPTIAWHPGDPVLVSPGELRHLGAADETVITYLHADRWAPTPSDLARLDASDLYDAVAVIDRVLTHRPDDSPFERATSSMLRRRIAGLELAVRSNDQKAIEAAADSLVGLGAGLTPSGDDVLTGLALVAASRGSRLHAVPPALRRVLDGEPPLNERTTAVSAATLTEAVRGRGRQRLHDLLHAVAAAPDRTGPSPLAGAVRRVLAIGHSSGADLLTGIRLGLLAEAGLRTTLTHTKEIR